MAEQTVALQGYVNDMLAVETEFHGAFRRQKDDAAVRRHADAHAIVSSAEDVIDRHLSTLKECLQRLGGTESVVKKAVGGVLGVAAGIYNTIRPNENASRVLRDDYAALCFGTVCYEMLHTTALAMKDERTADLALRNLKDFPPLIMAISTTMPSVLIRELAESSTVSSDASVAEDAVRNTRAAWAEASAAT